MHVDQASRLRQLAHQRLRVNEQPVPERIERQAKIYAITSGKGGVGKTNLSVNIAIALAKRGKRVVLVDLDLGLANVDIMLDLISPYTLEHLIRGEKTLDEIIIPGPAGIRIVPGGSGLPSLTEVTEAQRKMFLENFNTLTSTHDFIIFDTAAGISDNVIRFTLAADEIIVVTTEEPTAITDAYALMKVLSSKTKESNINLIFNMVKGQHDAHVNYTKVRAVVKQFLGIEIHDLGYILDDPCVSQAIMKRRPFINQYPFSPAAKSVKDVAQRILLKREGRAGRQSFVQKLSALLLR